LDDVGDDDGGRDLEGRDGTRQLDPAADVINLLFSTSLTMGSNKLECLSLAGLSSLV
jgi:hypothetical protein